MRSQSSNASNLLAARRCSKVFLAARRFRGASRGDRRPAGLRAVRRDRCKVDFAQAGFDLLQRRRLKPGRGQRKAQRIDVVARRDAAQQSRFDGRGAAAHERIVDDVARVGEPLDEEARQLRLEAGAIGDFVQRTGLALACGPELVDEGWNRAGAAEGDDLAGGLPEFAETGKFARRNQSSSGGASCGSPDSESAGRAGRDGSACQRR